MDAAGMVAPMTRQAYKPMLAKAHTHACRQIADALLPHRKAGQTF